MPETRAKGEKFLADLDAVLAAVGQRRWNNGSFSQVKNLFDRSFDRGASPEVRVDPCCRLECAPSERTDSVLNAGPPQDSLTTDGTALCMVRDGCSPVAAPSEPFGPFLLDVSEGLGPEADSSLSFRGHVLAFRRGFGGRER